MTRARAMASAATNYPAVQYSVTKLGGGVTSQGSAYAGGLDLTTPSLSLQTGALRDGINFECAISGGYSRIQGYERFDGRAAPSSASFQIVQLASFASIPAIGATITQATSGATGTVIAVNNIAGAYYVALTQVSGVFDDSHNLNVGATLIGAATMRTAAVSAKTNAIYLAAAADVYRALVGAVPGSGKLLGVIHMVFAGVDNVYAFRANAGGTAVVIYKATPTGWAAVPFFNSATFTVGTGPGGALATYVPPDGTTITQGGVTATVRRVQQGGGSFAPATHTGFGTLVVTNPTGGNFAAGVATLGDGSTVTLSGVQTPIAILPGGVYEFVRANFTGASATRRIYGCDGVNKAFEFDGTVYAPITTGNVPDQPNHITAHKNYLVVSQGSSILGSALGRPFDWTALDGAWEIAVGDDVTGMLTQPGDQTTASLAVFSRNNTYVLYGSSTADFNFVAFNTGNGALPGTLQNIFDTFVFDTLGIITLKTTLAYGNFEANTLTKNILPFIQAERSKITASAVQRTKGQYRVFFNDGYGLYLTTANAQVLGAGKVSFPNAVFCADNDNDSLGNEVSYFGSSDGLGFVYQLDKGTSFDGASITAYITPAWDPIKTPRILKRFRAASIEMQGDAYAEIQFGYQLGYGSQNIGQPISVAYPSGFVGAPLWDAFIWDNFVWDGQTLFPTDVDMTGTAENVQPMIQCSGNYIDAFTINSIIYHYSMRRGMRV
jgi:hypothetical protein